MKESLVGNFLIRLLSVACFELLLCSLINVRAYVPSAPGGIGTYSLSILVLISAFAAMVAMGSLYLHRGPYIAGSYEKGSLLQSFVWGSRPLSSKVLGSALKSEVRQLSNVTKT